MSDKGCDSLRMSLVTRRWRPTQDVLSGATAEPRPSGAFRMAYFRHVFRNAREMSSGIRASRPRARMLVRLVIAGTIFGAVTAAANHVHFPGGRLAAGVFDSAWLWLGIPYLLVWLGSGWKRCAWIVATFVIPAVWVYYVGETYAATTTPGFISIGVGSVIVFGIFYSLLGLAMSAALATVVWIVRRNRILGVPVIAAVPAYIAYSAFSSLSFARDGYLVAAEISIGVVATAAGLVALVVQGARLITHRSRNTLPRREA